MAFLKKNWIILLLVAVLIIAAVFYWKNKPVTDGEAKKSLGTTSKGVPYYESDVATKVGHIKGTPDWFNMIKTNAQKEGMDLNVALRKNAIYSLENYD